MKTHAESGIPRIRGPAYVSDGIVGIFRPRADTSKPRKLNAAMEASPSHGNGKRRRIVKGLQ